MKNLSSKNIFLLSTLFVCSIGYSQNNSSPSLVNSNQRLEYSLTANQTGTATLNYALPQEGSSANLFLIDTLSNGKIETSNNRSKISKSKKSKKSAK